MGSGQMAKLSESFLSKLTIDKNPCSKSSKVQIQAKKLSVVNPKNRVKTHHNKSVIKKSVFRQLTKNKPGAKTAKAGLESSDFKVGAA